jgi:predicted RNase H-like nuclease
VHFVGIDLAWGDRKPTGLAVLDEDGNLVHISTVRTDEEVLAHLAPFVEGDCVVGIDAPLVVKNATGSRPAEKQLSKDFRRFDAGTHPSNTAKQVFANGTRGARVAKLLGLDIDPRSGRRRRAIEVYPHPATIVLFSLDHIVRYKHKSGRDVDLLRSELLRLMALVESIVQTDETWSALRSHVERATKKSQLQVVEDQVDAVICAQVALLAHRAPDSLTTYGDLETGYIVTPSLTGATASVPAHILPAHIPSTAVQQYAAQHADLRRASDEAVALVTDLLDEAGINYLSVTGRAKSVASFAEKATRTEGGVPVYSDPASQISDQIGVRVITYVIGDVKAVAELLGDQVIVKDDRDMGQETASEGRFGYASRHLLIALDPSREDRSEYVGLRGRTAQVQVRTVLQHAWAEFEHDIRYKGSVPPEHVGEFDRRFTLAAGLIELADQEFATIRERLRGATPAARDSIDDDPRIDPRELAAYLAGQFADAAWSRAEHYGWISGLLLELSIVSLDELSDALQAVDADAIAERMDYRYPPGAVRRLDDALLWAYAERFVALRGNAHRTDALRARLDRLNPERPLPH